ncbi:MAG: hypothetical protein WEA77_11790 [Hyphomonas sp.]|uniref:hypothetical protein n=1 Tax=Hyphomonas sp. TaxID=87 RepID=UPI0034A03C0D
MFGNNWKARIEPARSGMGLDLSGVARRGRQFFESLKTTQQLVLPGPVTMGLFQLLVGQFKGGSVDEQAGKRFMGIMFMIVAAAATLGWTASGYTT